MESKISKILETFHADDLFIAPTIPTNKLANAYANYKIPNNKLIIALIDATVFGSAKNGMAITGDGLYWKNDWTTDSRKTFLTWDEISNNINDIQAKGSELLLGSGCSFGMAGAGMKPITLLKLLTEIEKIVETADKTENSLGQNSSTTPTVIAKEPARDTTGKIASNSDDSEASTKTDNLDNVKIASSPAPETKFPGKYDPEQLHIVNSIAKRHRLGTQVQVAPAVKVFKVRKILEICEDSVDPYSILAIVDNTFLQTAKDFMIVTPTELIAKGTLRKVDRFPILEIRKVHQQDKTLYINDYDFQFFDQLSENEVTILVNFLRELIPALISKNSKNGSNNDFPPVIERLLSKSYDGVLNDLKSEFNQNRDPQTAQAISTLVETLYDVFSIVHENLEHPSRDVSSVISQYLLAHTISSTLAFREFSALSDQDQLGQFISICLNKITSRILVIAGLSDIHFEKNYLWYRRIVETTMTSHPNDLQQNISEVLGELTSAQRAAMECAASSVPQVTAHFNESF